MRYLYDANLITALSHRDHSDHQRAVAWLRSKSNPPWATCEITQNALVRLSANPHVVPCPQDPAQTWRNLDTAMKRSDHLVLSLPSEAHTILGECLSRCQGYRQVTDAFLIAIAIANHAVLATCDSKLRQLSPDRNAVEVVPHL
jgi:toxin-antitoxin system PIN domain toxin